MKQRFVEQQISTVGLVAHYKLWVGLTGATTVFDYSLGGATGTVTGTNIAPAYPGFSFNGTDDFIDVGNQSSAIKTVMVWFKSPDAAIASFPIDLNGIDFFNIEGNELDTGGFAGHTAYIDGIAAVAVTNDTWHCVGLTIPTAKTASDFDIGRAEGQGLFTGTIGDVMLFDIELAASAMQSIYAITRERYNV